tara:strand:- start:407 stop:826 length:420 start_codon:yes stop_codon:yes gene_type:complete
LEIIGLKPIEASYYGGFFDGEGCIRLMETNKNKNKKTKYYTPRVSISSCYYPTLKYLADKMDRNLTSGKPKNDRCKPFYMFDLSGNKALIFIRAIAPYLKEKKEQAYLLLTYGEYPKRSAQHEAIYNQLRRLKRKNYEP